MIILPFSQLSCRFHWTPRGLCRDSTFLQDLLLHPLQFATDGLVLATVDFYRSSVENQPMGCVCVYV